MDPIQYARWLASSRSIWQLEFLSSRTFGEFCQERGLGLFASTQNVERLWSIGLLRADFVEVSDINSAPAGMQRLQDCSDDAWWADARRTPQRPDGWTGVWTGDQAVPDGVKPYFHPFRLYVMAGIHRLLDPHISRVQLLASEEGHCRLLSGLYTRFRTQSSSDAFRDRIDELNELPAWAILAEPCFYPAIAGSIVMRDGIEEGALDVRIEEHWEQIRPLFEKLGKEGLERLIDRVRHAANRLDENRDVQLLLRLANDDARSGLRGSLGGAVHLLTMVEILRRAGEKALDIRLPEENELVRVGYLPAAKTRLFGTDRIVDATPVQKLEFIRQLGLDFSLRVRWYAEGDTEFGAVRKACERLELSHLEVMNLSGRIQWRGVVTFIEDLKRDRAASFFSIVTLDGDRADHVAALRGAMRSDEICGEVRIAQPDFEFDNFTVEELAEVLWTLEGDGRDASERAALFNSVTSSVNKTDFFRRARGALVGMRTAANAAWGATLMEYALANPDRRDGTPRPVMGILASAARGRYANYQFTRAERRIDPTSGRLVPRAKAADA